MHAFARRRLQYLVMLWLVLVCSISYDLLEEGYSIMLDNEDCIVFLQKPGAWSKSWSGRESSQSITWTDQVSPFLTLLPLKYIRLLFLNPVVFSQVDCSRSRWSWQPLCNYRWRPLQVYHEWLNMFGSTHVSIRLPCGAMKIISTLQAMFLQRASMVPYSCKEINLTARLSCVLAPYVYGHE
jgi:hypothetical protein